MGLGLSMIFLGTGHEVLGTLGLVAALYHVLNHALFKGLLFLGAGAVLYRTHERDLDHMGASFTACRGTAAFFLVGCIAISALPPFNGFVSEMVDVAGRRCRRRNWRTAYYAPHPVTAALLASPRRWPPPASSRLTAWPFSGGRARAT